MNITLTDDERAKGFVRPVRPSYTHVGPEDGSSPGCGKPTTIPGRTAENFARDTGHYSTTFCPTCKSHFPVAHYVWTGTDERVGS